MGFLISSIVHSWGKSLRRAVKSMLDNATLFHVHEVAGLLTIFLRSFIFIYTLYSS